LQLKINLIIFLLLLIFKVEIISKLFIKFLYSHQVYGKTKEQFGFPEEILGGEELSSTNVQQITAEVSENQTLNVTPLDRMVSSMLDVIENGFYFLGGSNVDQCLKQNAIDVTTALLLLPTPGIIQQLSRSVLSTIHSSKLQYHSYKDREILAYISKELQAMLTTTNFKTIDPEGFYRLVLMIRNIAIQRPQQLAKICQENSYPIVDALMKLTKELQRISNDDYGKESIIHYGLTHKEASIQSLVEIFYAFIYTDLTLVETMVKFLMELLLDGDAQVNALMEN
jgi:E3 ubiquitin-protein ligase UBR4